MSPGTTNRLEYSNVTTDDIAKIAIEGKREKNMATGTMKARMDLVVTRCENTGGKK